MKERMIDPSRLIDRNDEKWAHPGIVDTYHIDGRASAAKLLDTDVPLEKRRAKRDKMYQALEDAKPAFFEAFPEIAEHGETKDYYIPGLNEGDPEVRVTVRFPKKRRKKNKVLFYASFGAFLFGTPWMAPIEKCSYDLDCIVVSPWIRTSLDAPYPAALDDAHAAYKWMVENATELSVHPDKVVITGLSAGGALSLALAFRLKRFGLRPRGVVAMDPVIDDRPRFASSQYVNDACDWQQVSMMWSAYLGPENLCSNALGPEAVPGRATVEDCRGLCPIVIHVPESCNERDNAPEFLKPVREAGVYTELHQWGGCSHSSYFAAADDNPQKQRYMSIYYGNIKDLWQYDLRRSWLWEEDEA